MTEITFNVAGTPKPQPRVKARVVRGRTPIAQIYTPGGAKEWKRAVSDAAALAATRPVSGPVEVEITIYAPRPARLQRRRDPRGAVRTDAHIGDADNYAKAILDALNGIAFEDDRQVTDLIVRKRYHAIGCGPGAKIAIRGAVDEPVLGETA